MCTNFALIKKDGSAALANLLGVKESELLYTSNAKPGATISIVTGGVGERVIRPATWWLYLQHTPEGIKPDRRYFSVNTNHKKLSSRPEFKRKRCIVPATAFVESQDGKKPHLLEPADGSAIAFGGLWKEYTDKVSGEVVWSASIITLPGIPALEKIHRKSTPLWLSPENFDLWLDPDMTDMAALENLMVPAFHANLKATPVDTAFKKNAVGAAFQIPVIG